MLDLTQVSNSVIAELGGVFTEAMIVPSIIIAISVGWALFVAFLGSR